MTEEQISAINDFDYEQFKAERIYKMHTQPLDVSVFYESDSDESDNALLKKFGDQISVTIEDEGGFSRYWWIEQLDTPELAGAIKALSQEDIEILTMIAFDGLTQSETGKLLGLKQQTIAKRMARIKKYLQNFKKTE